MRRSLFFACAVWGIVFIANHAAAGPPIPFADEGFSCFLNPAIGDAHWITIRLSGTQSNRFGIGARVEVMADGTLFVGEVLTTTSAFTAVHPQVHFGLGDRDQIDSIIIRWPSGIVTESTDVSADQIITLNEE